MRNFVCLPAGCHIKTKGLLPGTSHKCTPGNSPFLIRRYLSRSEAKDPQKSHFLKFFKEEFLL